MDMTGYLLATWAAGRMDLNGSGEEAVDDRSVTPARRRVRVATRLLLVVVGLGGLIALMAAVATAPSAPTVLVS